MVLKHERTVLLWSWCRRVAISWATLTEGYVRTEEFSTFIYFLIMSLPTLMSWTNWLIQFFLNL